MGEALKVIFTMIPSKYVIQRIINCFPVFVGMVYFDVKQGKINFQRATGKTLTGYHFLKCGC